MSRIKDQFQKASESNRMTFMPFITAGDPNPGVTSEVLKALGRANVDLIELGFPYSDPIADGPVIQASYTRALENGITVEAIFQMMNDLATDDLPPILAMVSYAIIFRFGTERFFQTASEAGFSGLIIPDLPADEAEEVATTARQYQLDVVQLIAPTTTEERTQQILNASSGFVYCISVAGTTGVRQQLPEELSAQLKSLRTKTDLPLAVGFGISGPDQVQALNGLADGIIVGSAVVRRVADAESTEAAVESVESFAREMTAAVSTANPSR